MLKEEILALKELKDIFGVEEVLFDKNEDVILIGRGSEVSEFSFEDIWMDLEAFERGITTSRVQGIKYCVAADEMDEDDDWDWDE